MAPTREQGLRRVGALTAGLGAASVAGVVGIALVAAGQQDAAATDSGSSTESRTSGNNPASTGSTDTGSTSSGSSGSGSTSSLRRTGERSRRLLSVPGVHGAVRALP